MLPVSSDTIACSTLRNAPVLPRPGTRSAVRHLRREGRAPPDLEVRDAHEMAAVVVAGGQPEEQVGHRRETALLECDGALRADARASSAADARAPARASPARPSARAARAPPASRGRARAPRAAPRTRAPRAPPPCGRRAGCAARATRRARRARWREIAHPRGVRAVALRREAQRRQHCLERSCERARAHVPSGRPTRVRGSPGASARRSTRPAARGSRPPRRARPRRW